MSSNSSRGGCHDLERLHRRVKLVEGLDVPRLVRQVVVPAPLELLKHLPRRAARLEQLLAAPKRHDLVPRAVHRHERHRRIQRRRRAADAVPLVLHHQPHRKEREHLLGDLDARRQAALGDDPRHADVPAARVLSQRRRRTDARSGPDGFEVQHELAAGLVGASGGPLDPRLAVEDHARFGHLTLAPAVPAVVQQGHRASQPNPRVVRPRDAVVPRAGVAVQLEEVYLRVLGVRYVHRGNREVVPADGDAVLGAHGELLDVPVRGGQRGDRRGMLRRREVLQLALERERERAHAHVPDRGRLGHPGGEADEQTAEPAEHGGVRGGSRRGGG
mmetsp:Transcript_14496/g.62866  ORF Transcript_14496/g.62866 Transcript_14496/m.62866 type:complete len:331 (-) Transcript_14496:219-1211(-)